MSVQGEITRISENLASAYSELESLGAEMPQALNSDALAQTIQTIAAVLYIAQSKTEEEKAIARSNIGAASAATYTAMIPTTGWSSAAPYSVQIAVDGMLASDIPFVDIVQTGSEDTDAPIREAWALVTRITTADGSITVYAAEEIPAVAIPIQMKVVR